LKSRSILIKNFSYAVNANLVSTIISILLIAILPKLLGIEEYAYWQLYLFYASFIGFFHFGWIDGIYLKYGGQEYEKLDKKKFRTQFWLLFIFQVTVLISVAAFTYFYVQDSNRRFIIYVTCICGILSNLRSFILFTLQLTNRIKPYAILTLSERIMYLVITVVFLLFGVRDYKLLVTADIIAKFISMICSVFYCNDIVFGKVERFIVGITEALDNIKVGINLMIANIASILIIGVVRFAIENKWGVSIFGKVSLSMSISNLLMILVTAISVILFPMLRRTNANKLTEMYGVMRTALMTILIGMMLFYYPAKVILSAWLPQYSESLRYMALMFPICIFESKTSMLISTYLKTLRKEKTILLANVFSVILSLVVSYITVYCFHNLELAVASIFFIIAFKCFFAEIMLSKTLKMNVIKDLMLELIMSFIFITSSWYINSWLCLVIYFIAYIIYIFIKKPEIISAIRTIRYIVSKT